MSDLFTELDAAQIQSVIARQIEAVDEYEQEEILRDLGVQYRDFGLAYWELFRRGGFPIWRRPRLWDRLVDPETLSRLDADLIVDFFCQMRDIDALCDELDFGDQKGPFFWTYHLDTLLMHACADDPRQVEARLSEFHPELRKGAALVGRRFGFLEREQLPDGAAVVMARFFLEGQLSWLHDYRDRGLVEVQGEEELERFISYFCPRQKWPKALLRALSSCRTSPRQEQTEEVWAVANIEELGELLRRVSISIGNHHRVFEVLLRRRDTPRDLAELASALAEEGDRFCSEFVAVTAAVAASRSGQSPPEELLHLIAFRSLSYVEYERRWDGLEYYVEALRAFDEEAVTTRFAAIFEEPYFELSAFAALKAYPHSQALLESAFDAVHSRITQHDPPLPMSTAAAGLAELGPSALELFIRQFDVSHHEAVKNVYRQTIIEILADAEEIPDDRFDSLLSIADFAEASDLREFWYRTYLLPLYRSLLAKLSTERALHCVESDLDADKPHWYRALGLLADYPRPQLLKRASELLATASISTDEQRQWIDTFVSELPDEFAPYLATALARNNSPVLHDMVRDALGDDSYERLLDEATDGSAPDLSPVAQLRHLSEKFFEENPQAPSSTVYVFELDDSPFSNSTLNRIGGRPFGISAEQWPQRDEDPDRAMTHVVTIDLTTLPDQFRERFDDEARALSVFVYDPPANEAWQPHSSQSKVVFLRDTDEFRGELPAGDPSHASFSVREVDVPSRLWSVESGTDRELESLRESLYRLSAWGGGQGSIWLQFEEHTGDFLFQCDSRFVPMNLGDAGLLYVFADTAFWQCH